MGVQDANFQGSIFRKDNPVVLAMRRDQAVLVAARLVYDGFDYLPGQCLVRNKTGPSSGLFQRWSTASGGSYDSPCILFDQATVPAQQANQTPIGTTGGTSGATLVRVLTKAIVWTTQLTDYDANFTTQLKSTDFVDAAGNQFTKF